MKYLVAAAALAASVLLSTAVFAADGVMPEGCAAGRTFTAGSISVSGAFARASLPGAKIGGGYFTISNAGAEGDTLTGASTAAARTVQVHKMSMANGVMSMDELPNGLDVPAGGTVSLAPSGDHLMVIGLAAPWPEGGCVAVTLHFARAGDLAVELNIGSTAAATAPGATSPAADAGGDIKMAPAH